MQQDNNEVASFISSICATPNSQPDRGQMLSPSSSFQPLHSPPFQARPAVPFRPTVPSHSSKNIRCCSEPPNIYRDQQNRLPEDLWDIEGGATLDTTPQSKATGIGTLSLGAAAISEGTTQQYSSEGAPLDAGAIDGTMPQYMATEIETPSLNSAVIGGSMQQYSGAGMPAFDTKAIGGATGTGMLSLNSGAVSGDTTPQYMATHHSTWQQWCNGNRNAVSEFRSNQRRYHSTVHGNRNSILQWCNGNRNAVP